MRYSDEHWLWVKRERAKQAGDLCEWSGCVRPHHDAHHVTYQRRGREWVEDIRLLCREHHDELHGIGGPIPAQLGFDDLIRAHAPSMIVEEVPNNIVRLEDLLAGRILREFKGGLLEALASVPSHKLREICAEALMDQALSLAEAFQNAGLFLDESEIARRVVRLRANG